MVRVFKTGIIKEHDLERSGRPRIQSDENFKPVQRKLWNDGRMTMSILTDEFAHFDCILDLHDFHRKTRYHKLCARRVPEKLDFGSVWKNSDFYLNEKRVFVEYWGISWSETHYVVRGMIFSTGRRRSATV